MKVHLFRPSLRNTRLLGVQFKTEDNDWLELYFSYATIVAFHERGHRICVSENHWSSTTGRHLNEIDNGRKENRISSDEFQRELDEAYKRFFGR